jgi:hypothetical protein
MAKNHCNHGPDERCRDLDRAIRRKRSHTRVDALRNVYGDEFTPEIRGDATLGTLLDRAGVESFSQLLRDPHWGGGKR